MMMDRLPELKDDITEPTIKGSPYKWWKMKTRREKTFFCLLLVAVLCLGMAISFPWVYILFRANMYDQSSNLMPRVESCGNWMSFKNEKCFKIVSSAGHRTQEEAEAVCKSLSENSHRNPSVKLLSIASEEEQAFLQHFIFEEKSIVDNVWLSLKRVSNNGTFQWNDGTSITYSNWANQSVIDDKHQCVQMEPGKQAFWARANCKKSNIVVCERMQFWSLSTIQSMFLNSKLGKEMEFAELKQKMTNAIKAQEQLESKNEAANKRLKALEEKNAVSRMKYAESDSKIRKLEMKNQAAEDTIKDLQKTNQATEQKITELESKNEDSDKKITELKVQNEAAEQNISDLASNKDVADKKIRELEEKYKEAVPVGFIYAQLPSQQPPTVLWPNTNWTDVSSSYAGLFFRVVGEKAGAFGAIQEQTSPKLLKTSYGDVMVRDSAWGSSGNAHLGMSDAEVRPRNQAIKIWRRIR